MKLPDKFLEKLKRFPGSVYEDYLRAMEEPIFAGLRVNTLKCDLETVRTIIGGESVPFCGEGLYLGENRKGLGSHPLHHAGAFYIQEPSAMSAVSALAPEPGDRVLDLCAAPGGKATQIAARLRGQGLLVANEFVGSRARILASNMERMGVSNAVVTSAHPDLICGQFGDFFDKILVDAPCSGEGMFRKEPEAVQDWSQEHVEACAARQLKILESAAGALAPGGTLCYSTCTFSPEENEGVVAAFLKRHEEFRLIPIKREFGMPAFPALGGGNPEIALCRRVFPINGGEGHFAALMRRTGSSIHEPVSRRYDAAPAAFSAFWQGTFCSELPENLRIRGQYVFITAEAPKIDTLNLLRSGVLAGELVKGRFEPAHALFMCPDFMPRQMFNLALNDPKTAAFLHGEQIEAPDCENGFVSVRIAGVPCGFGKVSGGVLKNRYPKGLRTLR